MRINLYHSLLGLFFVLFFLIPEQSVSQNSVSDSYRMIQQGIFPLGVSPSQNSFSNQYRLKEALLSSSSHEQQQSNLYILALGMIFNADSPEGYCTTNLFEFGCQEGDGINSFSLGDIQNMNSGCSPDGYGDFTHLSTELMLGVEYEVVLSSNYQNQYVSIWIDFNDNYLFEENERILQNVLLPTSGVLYNFDLTLPAHSNIGIHRMRVRANYIVHSIDPCAFLFYGEVEDYTVTVSGETYTLTYLAGANGTISGQAVQTVNHGGNGTAVTAVPDAGYHFVSWSDGNTDNPRKDLNVTADLTVTANFALNTYIISATTGANGNITPSGNIAVGHGQNQSFAITADAGYHIADVLVNGVSVGPVSNYQFLNVTANQSIHASFAINTYTLTYLAGANGTISGQAVQTVNHGGNGTAITAVPDAGYQFVSWSDGNTSNPRTDVNVTANLTVTANFALNTYTIVATTGANGSITPIGNIAVGHGQNQSFAITADAGYHIADVLVNGVSVGAVSNYQFLNVTANQSIHASFAINTYTLTYLAGTNGSITGEAVQTVNHGGNGTAITAVPDAGYHFVSWSDGNTSNPRTDVNVTANLTVTANFALNTYTIAATAGANGSITPSGNIAVGHGQNQSFAITADASYHIADVLVNGVSVGTVSNYQFLNVMANQSIHASFAINTYTLTYLAGTNGSITGEAVQTVNHGGNGTAITAVPDAGYQFVSWSDGNTSNPRTDVNVTADLTVTANFTLNTYTIIATAGANGNITPSGNIAVGHGQNQSFAITADAGYHIADVLVNGVSVGAVSNYQFLNVTANQSIHASFAINTYTLTYLAGANGTISGQAVQTVNHGGNGTAVTAVPDAGYHFVSWSDGNTSNPRTDVNVTADLTVTANFALNTYTIVATAGANGSITPSGNIAVGHGQNQSFAITADAGYHIADVLVNGVSVGAVSNYQFLNVTANQSIHASFAINTYTLTYLAGANGSITGEAVQTVNHGGNGTAITAVPDAGYQFVSWSDGNTSNPRTDVNVTANLTVTANFALNTYTIAATAGANGSITPSGNIAVSHGQNQSFAITADAGYHIADVLVNGVSVGAVSNYQFLNVTANQSIHASFAINTYTLTYLAGANGTISGQAVQTVNHGGNGTAITAVPDAGYQFVSWSDGNTSNPRTDVNVTANLTVTANFALNTYTISATAGANGNITPSGNIAVGHGQNQSFAITADAGYHIADVLVNGVSVGAVSNYQFLNVTANQSIHASFAINTYTLTYLAGTNGSITGEAVQTVNHGGNGTAITAVPDAGYHFVSWSDGNTSNPRTDLNVTADLTVTANFALNTYTIAATTGANGSITPSGNIAVSHGQNQSFAITADAGYHIADVLVNGVSVGAVSNYQFLNVTANQSIHASFAINTYTLSASSGTYGSINPAGNIEVNHGQNMVFNFIPDAGYRVFAVYVDGENIGTPENFEFTDISSNRSIHVEFTLITGLNMFENEIVTVWVFPVPSKDILNIKIEPWNVIQEELQYEIMDYAGRLLSLGQIQSDLTSISVEKLSAGSYYIRIIQNNKTGKVLKFMKTE